MASLWEIADPSNLAYNTALGSTKPDSGQGPPSSEQGWVRTGYASSDWINPGIGNCDVWTSNSYGSGYGSVAYLPHSWDASGGGQVDVWLVASSDCYYPQRVWCIED